MFPALSVVVICVSDRSETVPIEPLFSTNLSCATLDAILSFKAFICWSRLPVGVGFWLGVGVVLAHDTRLNLKKISATIIIINFIFILKFVCRVGNCKFFLYFFACLCNRSNSY